MDTISTFFRQTDMFGQPFIFRTEATTKQRSYKQKTTIGAVTTILLIIISLLYLIFLLYEYISGKIPPVISSLTIQQNGAVQEAFDVNPLNINILVPGDYQSVDIEDYFTVYLVLIGTLHNETIKLDDSNPSFRGDQLWFSFPINDHLSKLALRQNPNDKKDNQIFHVLISKCTSGGSCASDLNAMMTDDDTEVEIEINFKELDLKTGKLVQKKNEVYSIMDPSTSQMVDLQLFVGSVETDTGFLWSVYNNQTYVTGYETHSEFYDESFLEDRYSGDNSAYTGALKIIKVHLGRCKNAIKYYNLKYLLTNNRQVFQNFNIQLLETTEELVVYEKFTSVMAKFLALFNTLMILGILARIGSEAKIFEMLMDSHLLTQYKISAAQIYNQKKNQHLQNPQRNGKVTNYSENLQKQEYQKPKNFSDLLPDAYSPLLDLPSTTSTKLFATGPRKYANFEKQQKEQQDNKKFGSDGTPGNQDFNQNENILEYAYISQYANVAKQMDFRTLFKEISEVKSALQLLFTPEQYAALQFVGRSIPQNDIQNSSNFDIKNKNHLEQIELVVENKEFQNQKLLAYLNNKEFNSDLDKKIKNCLIPQVFELKEEIDGQQTIESNKFDLEKSSSNKLNKPDEADFNSLIQNNVIQGDKTNAQSSQNTKQLQQPYE
ncbi:hypothetical protein PPERSA_02540 [Pseudocohnilembus persalinus]|uniref:Transmembrane protein n=1 Tax=Pseudocohnilembus persalinus TaxID=266149 RepID=A0A0V0R5A1_PSEPJ|nr:hypothetical protein PPERSA_02540 [Pseudocohnilembus persalinus]|eukprot:KRX09668.1 hypothetical protein PPERSA_02540 [Pseudocohnilembus persalinus]